MFLLEANWHAPPSPCRTSPSTGTLGLENITETEHSGICLGAFWSGAKRVLKNQNSPNVTRQFEEHSFLLIKILTSWGRDLYMAPRKEESEMLMECPQEAGLLENMRSALFF